MSEGAPAAVDQLPEDPAGRVRALLERIVGELGIEAEVSVAENDDEIIGSVDGDDVDLLIGRNGQTIDAVQLVCYQAAFCGRPDRKRVTVDASGYRRRRADALVRRAEMAALEAAQDAREIDLEPMSASERRVVHEHLRDRPELETYSEGDEPHRYVVIAPLVSG